MKTAKYSLVLMTGSGPSAVSAKTPLNHNISFIFEGSPVNMNSRKAALCDLGPALGIGCLALGCKNAIYSGCPGPMI